MLFRIRNSCRKKGLLLTDHDVTKGNASSPKSLQRDDYPIRKTQSCCVHFCQKQHYRDFQKTKKFVSKDKEQKVPQALLRFTRAVLVHPLKFLICSSKNTTLTICSSYIFSSVHRSSCFCSSLLICSLSCRSSATCKVRKHHDFDFLWPHGNLLSSIRQSGDFIKTWLVIL